MQVVTLCLFRFAGLGAKSWALAQMGFSRRALARAEGLTFLKMLGTGSDAGFHPIPNLAVYGLLAVWRDGEAARAGVAGNRAFRAYRERAAEWACFHLRATRARGAWAGCAPFAAGPDGGAAQEGGPVAVLTRATLRPRHAAAFWRRVPAISAALLAEPDLRFRIGLGEVPWLHQVTFSIWDDARRMRAFAMTSQSHGAAVAAVRRHGWFREQLFARFAVEAAEGRWDGRPVDGLCRPGKPGPDRATGLPCRPAAARERPPIRQSAPRSAIRSTAELTRRQPGLT